MRRSGMLLAFAASIPMTVCDGAPARDEGTPRMTISIDERGTDSRSDPVPNSLTDAASFAGVRVYITGLRRAITLTAADFIPRKTPQRNYDYIIENIPQQGTAVVHVQLSQDGEIAAQGEVRLILHGSTYEWVLSLTRALDPLDWSVIRGDTTCKLPVPLGCVAVHRYPIREDIANYHEEALWLLIQHDSRRYGCPLNMVC